MIFNWNDVLNLRERVELSLFECDINLISGDLYQIAIETYVISQPDYSKIDLPGLLGVLFFWAPSTGAVLRSALRDVSQDTGETVCPPEILLLDGWRWTYRDILRVCEGGKLGRFHEFPFKSARGQIGRSIAVGMFSYFFRENSGGDDKAFSVAVDVRGSRWNLVGETESGEKKKNDT